MDLHHILGWNDKYNWLKVYHPKFKRKILFQCLLLFLDSCESGKLLLLFSYYFYLCFLLNCCSLKAFKDHLLVSGGLLFLSKLNIENLENSFSLLIKSSLKETSITITIIIMQLTPWRTIMFHEFIW